jgi:hypothetical protein
VLHVRRRMLVDSVCRSEGGCSKTWYDGWPRWMTCPEAASGLVQASSVMNGSWWILVQD